MNAFTRAYRFELLRLRRPAVLAGTCGLAAALAALGTVLTFTRAVAGRAPADFGRSSLTTLASPQGLSTGFALGMSLLGLLVLVLFCVNTTSEYAQGTWRSLLVRQPSRGILLAGKVAAGLTLVVDALLVGLVVSVALAVPLAGIRHVPTADWWTASGLGAVAGAYLNAFLGCAFFALAGTALAVLLRSTAVALAVGIAWTFPLEHIVQNAWSGATGWFPGLLFSTVANGGSVSTSYERSLTLGAAYALVAAVIAIVAFRRRDVTA